MLGVGIDIVEVERIARMMERFGERFLQRVFTPDEQAYCRRRHFAPVHYAARFAAKEAAVKAFGGQLEPVVWRELEVVALPSGKPRLVLHGRAYEAFAALGGQKIFLSLSHTRTLAVAQVVFTGERKENGRA